MDSKRKRELEEATNGTVSKKSRSEDTPIITSDFNTIIDLDLRGKPMRIYKYILLKSTYFRCILGDSDFKPSTPQSNGAYFVDCDYDVFRIIVGYLETGLIMAKNQYTNKFLKFQMDKFGIEYDPNMNLSYFQKKKMKMEQFKETFGKFLLEQCETGIDKLEVNFIQFDGEIEHEIRNGVVYWYYHDELVCPMLNITRHEFIMERMFNEMVQPDYVVKVTKPSYDKFTIKITSLVD